NRHNQNLHSFPTRRSSDLTFKQKLSTTSQQVQELQASLKDKQKVDLTALEQQLTELKKAYETALNQRDQSKKYYQEATALIKNIDRKSTRLNSSHVSISYA